MGYDQHDHHYEGVVTCLLTKNKKRENHLSCTKSSIANILPRSIAIDRKLAGKVFLVLQQFICFYSVCVSVCVFEFYFLPHSIFHLCRFPIFFLRCCSKTNERTRIAAKFIVAYFSAQRVGTRKKITHPPHGTAPVVVYFSVKLKYAFFMGSMRFFAALSPSVCHASPPPIYCLPFNCNNICWGRTLDLNCIYVCQLASASEAAWLCILRIRRVASPHRASQWDFRFRNLIKERELRLRLTLPVANELKQWKNNCRN